MHQRNEEAIQEMLMIHTRPTFVGPLRQHNKSTISYHVLDGEPTVKLHNKIGVVPKNNNELEEQ